MSTKTQIGAVIGIEGGSAYLKTIRQLTEYTKLFESDMKALTSSFDANEKSIKNLKDQKNALLKIIQSENDKLVNQKQMMENINKAASDVRVSDEKWATAQRTVQTEINNTTANINLLRQELEKLNEENALTLVADAWANASSKTGEVLKSIGDTMTRYITLPIVGGMAASAKSAMDWESAFNGVRKTVDASEEQFEALEKSIKNIALETGTSSRELAGIAEAGGQLNVPIDRMEEFVRTIEALAISTNLTSDEAATNLARIMNITGDTWDNFSKIGDVIVHLGNNTATTEEEIVQLANRMASAAHLAGFATPEIFALSAALSSVGIRAEAGGSTVGQVLTKIQKEFEYFKGDTENNLETIAKVAGMSADEFARSWTEKPAEAFLAFVTGLGNMDEESESLILTLDDLDMTGIRESNMLKALASAQDENKDSTQLLTDALNLANQAWSGLNENGEEWSAMMTEADVRHNESATQFKKLKESVTQLADAFGENLVPVIIPIVDGLTSLIRKFSEMDDSTKNMVLGVGGLIAVSGPVIGLIGNILIWGAKLKAAIGVFTGAAGVGGLTASIAGEGGLVSAITGGKGLISAISGGGGLLSSFVGTGGAIAVFTWAKEVVKKLHDEISVFQNKVDAAGDESEYAKQRLAELGYTWDELGNLVEISNNEINNSTLDMSNVVEDDLLRLRDEARQKMIEAGALMTKAIKDEAPQFQNETYKFVNTGVEEIRNVSGEAFSYGRDFGNNFADGIKSKVSTVISAVSNLASRVRAYLHFSEPDVGPLSDFHTWMPDMMKGLAEGIDANAYLVDNAIANVADKLSLNGNKNNAINYGGVIINLNVPAGANGQQLVNEIETELANRTMRRKAVFG